MPRIRWMFLAFWCSAPLFLQAQKTSASAYWTFDADRKAWAVVNPNGVTCTDFVFQNPVPFRQNLAAAQKGNKYFLVLPDGKLLPDTFDLLMPATEGYYFSRKKGTSAYWVNTEGKDTVRIHRDLPRPGIGRQRVYESGKKFGLLDSSGLFLTPPLYDNLVRTSGPDSKTYIAQIGKQYGLLNPRGQVVLPLEYESLSYWSENFIMFQKDGRYGTMDVEGKIRLPARYERITRIYDNGPFSVLKDGRKGILDRWDHELIPPQYDDVKPSFQPLSYTYREGKKYGIIDSTGKLVAPARYDQLDAYSSGVYHAVENGLHGVVGYDGVPIVPCRYESLYMNSHGTFLVKESGKWTLLDHKGASLFALPDGYEAYAVACSPALQLFEVRRKLQYGLMDRQQQLVLPMEYSTLIFVNDTLFIISKDNKYGLLNPIRHNPITPMVYDHLSTLDNTELLLFQQNGRYGLLDHSGKEICPARYTDIRSFGNHQLLAERKSALRTKYEDASGFGKTEQVVIKDDRRGDESGNTTYVFLDSAGQEIPKLKFSAVGELHGGMARVKNRRKEGWINADARLVYPVEFIEFEYLNGPYTRVRQYGSGFWGIRSAGREVIPCMYDQISVFLDGYVRVQKGENRFYVDEHNQAPVLSREEAAKQLQLPATVLDAYEAFGYAGEENGWIRVRQGGKWGWIDARGKEQIPCHFDATTPFRNNRARVLVPGHSNDLFVNRKGELLLGQ